MVQLIFQKSRGSIQLAVELLDTEEDNSDEHAEAEVKSSIMRPAHTHRVS